MGHLYEYSSRSEAGHVMLDVLLSKCTDEGVLKLDANVLAMPAINIIGKRIELIRICGGKHGFERAVRVVHPELYSDVY